MCRRSVDDGEPRIQLVLGVLYRIGNHEAEALDPRRADRDEQCCFRLDAALEIAKAGREDVIPRGERSAPYGNSTRQIGPWHPLTVPPNSQHDAPHR
jgi:hypothetical protein